MIDMYSTWIWGWIHSLESSVMLVWVFFLGHPFYNSFFFVGGPSLLEDVFVVSFWSPSLIWGHYLGLMYTLYSMVLVSKLLMKSSEIFMLGFTALDPLFFERNVCHSNLVRPAFGFSLHAFNDYFSQKGFCGFSHSCLHFPSLVMLVCLGFDVSLDRGPSRESWWLFLPHISWEVWPEIWGPF
jgi:hypothetical protein